MFLNKKINKNIFTFVVVFIVLNLFIFYRVEAVVNEYIMLEPLPGFEDGKVDIESYLPKIFTLSLQLATALAVFMISFGGFKYLTEESFTGKSDARKIITNAIQGLLILLTSWLLLYTLNPDLVKNNFIIPKVNTKKPLGSSSDIKSQSSERSGGGDQVVPQNKPIESNSDNSNNTPSDSDDILEPRPIGY